MDLDGLVSFEAKCVRCRVTRDVPTESHLTLEYESDDVASLTHTVVVSTPDKCECGERRVRVRVGIKLG